MGYVDKWQKMLDQEKNLNLHMSLLKARMGLEAHRDCFNKYWNKVDVKIDPALYEEWKGLTEAQLENSYSKQNFWIQADHEISEIAEKVLPGISNFLVIYNPTDDGWGSIDNREAVFRWLDSQAVLV